MCILAYIDNENKKASDFKIPLAGIAVGDGWIDPVNMVPGYPDMMFNQGLIDLEQKKVVQNYTDRTEAFIKQNQMLKAFEVRRHGKGGRMGQG